MIEIPVRLASRARLLAADVAAAFAPLVAAINGGLGVEHFSPGRWIANAVKAAPRSYIAVTIDVPRIAATGAKTYLARVFPEHVALEAVRWTAAQDQAAIAYNWDGTVKLYRNGVQIGTTQNIVNAAVGALGINEALASAPSADDTTFSVEVNPTNLKGGSIANLKIVIWCKAPHVR
jgi:fermentation-respiration switch protein FrsA (DUF1100 family)